MTKKIENPKSYFKSFLNEGILDHEFRPALSVYHDDIERSSIKEINEAIDLYKQRILGECASVGKIFAESDDESPIGTCWVIKSRYAATCEHVTRGFWAKLLGDDERYFVDFNGSVSGERQRIRISRIAARDESTDVAIMELDKLSQVPPALKVADFDAILGQNIYIVGFPSPDVRINFSHEALKGPVVKRLMPGLVVTEDNTVTFGHDCTTTGGASGSPVLDLHSGKVIGVHSKYREQAEMNVAVSIGKFIEKLNSLSS